jgi:hypothetical protein
MRNIKIYEEYSYGWEDIKKIELDKDSDVWLEDDMGGENLRGEKVSTLEYAIRMLENAEREQNWGTVRNAITYLKTKQ